MRLFLKVPGRSLAKIFHSNPICPAGGLVTGNQEREGIKMNGMTATYSPDDNKLRLYSMTRLDSETYTRVKTAGFKWAPKQDLFVAPMWTPAREDLLLELCEEIGDEDTSLVDRAEQRAERFEDYSDRRAGDSQKATAHVKSIADGIPFGQPILVGHHSEKHARKHAEQIENGMRKAVKMWDQAKYWTSRAAGALSHAKYKERPDVRARRIKTIEADKRKQERTRKEAEKFLKAYTDPEARGVTLKDGRELLPALLVTWEGGLSHEDTRRLEDGELDFETALEMATAAKRRVIEWCNRWISHYDNRLSYERAMLDEAGGTKADQTKPEKGGACKCWATGRGRGCWSKIVKVNKVSVTVLDNWGNGGRDFTRTMPFDKLSALMSAGQVEQARAEGRILGEDDRSLIISEDAPAKAPTPAAPEAMPAEIQAMKDSLKAGVQTVAVDQLFPTPPGIAAYMVELAEIEPGMDVLEPSAGTGNLIGAMGGSMFDHNPERGSVTAVEINQKLAARLETEFPLTAVHCADFLEWTGEQFDRIIANPPFVNGADIKHIRHAFGMLKPGGRLISLCANGPRQREEFKNIADLWETLPEGSFQEQGTGVSVALVVLRA